MYAPVFVVQSIKEQADGAWKVAMKHGSHADQFVDLTFPTEERAREFSLYRPYTPDKILELAGRQTEEYTLEEVERVWKRTGTNPVTDRPDLVQSWKATLASRQRESRVEWTYRDEAEVRSRFKPGKTYKMLDFFGTLQAVPVNVAEAYEFAAERQRQLDEEAERLKKELEEARKEQARLKAIAANKAAAKKAAQEAARQKAAQAAAAARAAAAQAALKAQQAARNQQITRMNLAIAAGKPATVGVGAQYGAGTVYVVKGGAAGTYNGKYYYAGQAPYNGLVKVTFVPG